MDIVQTYSNIKSNGPPTMDFLATDKEVADAIGSGGGIMPSGGYDIWAELID